MSGDRIGPWDFARSVKYPALRSKHGPLFTSDIPDLETVARRKKAAQVAALPDDPPVRKKKPVAATTAQPSREPSMLELLKAAKTKAGKL